jgi:hypothetical protein
MRLGVSHLGLANTLASWCGQSAHSKKIPAILFESPDSVIQAFFAGYVYGDGHYDCSRPGGRFRASTVSKTLAMQLQILAAKTGHYINVSLHHLKAHKLGDRIIPDGIRFTINFPRSSAENLMRTDFVARWKSVYNKDLDLIAEKSVRRVKNKTNAEVTSDAIYVPIASITADEYNGPVFNIQTNDSTFAVPFITHNCGTPVIAYSDGALEETVKDGFSGYVVEKGNIDAMADSLMALDKSLVGINPRNCRQWAEENFSMQKMAGRYIELMTQVCVEGKKW